MTIKEYEKLESLLQKALDKAFREHAHWFDEHMIGDSNAWLRTYDKLSDALIQLQIHKAFFLDKEGK